MLKKRLDYSQLKVIQLNILKDVDAFCRENNITYYLTYGTLLGAVRHQGYIPWDDDIDIAMPRKDYEKFLSNYNLNGSKKNVYQVVAIELNN
ncbi:LicD family protein, partial [Bacteroides fragilis]